VFKNSHFFALLVKRESDLCFEERLMVVGIVQCKEVFEGSSPYILDLLNVAEHMLIESKRCDSQDLNIQFFKVLECFIPK
jgi:hypothetical protein